MVKKVLLIDTNFSAAPIYNFLVDSGFDVYVVGANPKDFLAKSARNYIALDYSNVEQTRKKIEKMNVDYIVPGCNDRSYQVCAALNAKGNYCGLDSLEQTEILNKKDTFRAFAARIGLPVPRLLAGESMGKVWPVIVKPVDAYSGHGMTIVQKHEQLKLQPAIERAKEFSQSGTCIVEEYVQGQLYSHSAFITNGIVVADFIVEEHGTANPFVVDTSCVRYDFSREMLGRIRAGISLLAKKLDLADGLVHTQFIMNGGSFWLIEVTRRCPGDLYSQLIELSTGFRYAEAYAKPFINQKFSFRKNAMKRSWVMRHTISQPAEGVLGSIQFHVPVQIEKMVPLSVAGDMIKASPFSRVALLFLRSKTKKELSGLIRKTLNRSLYTIHQTQ